MLLVIQRRLINCNPSVFILIFLLLFFSQYGLFLLVILILEVTACGLAAAYKNRAKTETKNYLQTTISKYYSSHDRNQSDAVTLMWNYLMSEMHCCGVDDYRDFALSDKWNESKGNRIIPEACCMQTALFEPLDRSCPYSPSDSNSYYKKVDT